MVMGYILLVQLLCAGDGDLFALSGLYEANSTVYSNEHEPFIYIDFEKEMVLLQKVKALK